MRNRITDEQHADMVKMLKGLSAAERKTLTDPDFITETKPISYTPIRR